MTDSRPPQRDVSTQEGLDLYDRNRLAPAFFAVLFITSFAALVYTVAAFIHDIVLALVLVAMFRPFYHRISRALGGVRWAASAIVTLLIVVLVAAPIAFLALSLIDQAQEAYLAFEAALADPAGRRSPLAWVIEEGLPQLERFGIRVSPEQVREIVENSATVFRENALAAGGGVLSGMLELIVHASVLLMLVFYLLVDADRLRDFVYRLSPLPTDEEELLTRRFGEVALGTLIGNGIGSVAQGALCGIAMWVVGLPSALFGAAVMSLFAFLPLIGVSIVVIPLSVYLAFQKDVFTAVTFFGFCMGQAVVFENVVKTKLIGSTAAMPDLLAFMAIIGGLGVFGVLGLLYGPLIATAFLTLSDLYQERYHRAMALNFMGRRL